LEKKTGKEKKKKKEGKPERGAIEALLLQSRPYRKLESRLSLTSKQEEQQKEG